MDQPFTLILGTLPSLISECMVRFGESRLPRPDSKIHPESHLISWVRAIGQTRFLF